MDPKGIFRTDTLDGAKIPGVADSGKDKTYSITTVYNDGTTITRWYRYNDQSVTGPGGRKEDAVVKEMTGEDTDRKKDWEKILNDAKPPGGITERVNPGTKRREGWEVDPTTGKGAYTKDLGPSEPSGAARQVKESHYEQDAQGKVFEVTTYTDGTNSREEVKPNGPTGGTILDRGEAGTYVVKADGSVVKVEVPVKPKEEKEEVREIRPGVWVRVVRAPNGDVIKFEPVKGSETPPPKVGAWTPDWNKPQLGLLERRNELLKQRADGTITNEQYLQQLKEDYEFTKAAMEQVTGLANVQAGIRNSDITQRGQDITLANARLGAADAAFSNAQKGAEGLIGKLPAGSNGAGDYFQSTLDLQRANAQRYGGLNDIGRVASSALIDHLGKLNPLSSGAADPAAQAGGTGLDPTSVRSALMSMLPTGQISQTSGFDDFLNGLLSTSPLRRAS